MRSAAKGRPSTGSIREHLDSLGWAPDEALLESLLTDPRAGVRSLGRRVLARRARLEAEKVRQRRMLRLESEQWGRCRRAVAGVDEVGRGPLAGPVVAAAVVLPEAVDLPGVDDSKRLTPERRERLFPTIFGASRAVGVGVVWQDEVDRLNIRNATFLAMRKALGRLRVEPDFVLVDGEAIPGLATPQVGIVRGDQRSLSIAAASIVAKVVRDRIMRVLDRRYPGYGFRRHKGYGTAAHRAAIRDLGPSVLHRRSFLRGDEEVRVARTREVGRKGEGAAVRFLESLGFEILETNYRWKRAEVDVIAREGERIVFVEVKTRTGDSFGGPESAVDLRKQRQIGRVAAHYLQARGLEDRDCRFDVLGLRPVPGPEEFTVDHLRDAFWIDRQYVL